eukprot:4754977-Prymnesium_polylepis.1
MKTCVSCAISSDSRRISFSFFRATESAGREAPAHGGVKRRQRRPGSSGLAWHVVPCMWLSVERVG